MTVIELCNSTLTAIVDDSDAPIVLGIKWGAMRGRKTFYAIATIEGKPTLMHRLLLQVSGRGNHIDHKNGNGLDNRRDNIRECNATQNNINRAIYKNNKVGIKGVNQLRSGRFGARITIHNRLTHIGIFDTAEDAGRAYDKCALFHHGEFANLNFPD